MKNDGAHYNVGDNLVLAVVVVVVVVKEDKDEAHSPPCGCEGHDSALITAQRLESCESGRLVIIILCHTK